MVAGSGVTVRRHRRAAPAGVEDLADSCLLRSRAQNRGRVVEQRGGRAGRDSSRRRARSARPSAQASSEAGATVVVDRRPAPQRRSLVSGSVLLGVRPQVRRPTSAVSSFHLWDRAKSRARKAVRGATLPVFEAAFLLAAEWARTGGYAPSAAHSRCAGPARSDNCAPGLLPPAPPTESCPSHAVPGQSPVRGPLSGRAVTCGGIDPCHRHVDDALEGKDPRRPCAKAISTLRSPVRRSRPMRIRVSRFGQSGRRRYGRSDERSGRRA